MAEEIRQDDLTIKQGTTWEARWQIIQDGMPADLTGWSVRSQIRDTKNKLGNLLYSWDSSIGNASILDNSTVSLRLKPTETSLWVWQNNKAYYDVELYREDDPERVHRFTQGTLKLSLEVTD